MKHWSQGRSGLIVFAAIFFVLCGRVFSLFGEVSVAPIHLDELGPDSVVTRSIYKVQGMFTDSDSVVFLEQQPHLRIDRVTCENTNTMIFSIRILPGFDQLGEREIAVVNSAFTRKALGKVEVNYHQWPSVNSTWLKTRSAVKVDTLTLLPYGTTTADLMLKGNGFYPATTIQFDDPAITVLNDVQNRRVLPPDSMQVRIVIDGAKVPETGWKRFTITNPNVMQGEGRILLRSSRPPQITNTLGFLEPDGREIVLELRGVNFSKFADVRTEPACPNCRATVISAEKIKLFLTLPVLQENKNYQILINNPDGQQAVKGFTALAKRLDSAHAVSATKRELFSGQESLIAVTLKLKRYERLNPNAGYELIMGGGAFRASQTRNDSTLIFQVRIPQAPLDTENTMHPFSIRVAGKAARWGGMLAAVTAPKITGISENMIIHPTDTLQVILKGAYLENVVASFEDPELSIQVLESAGDRLRFNVIAGPDVALGTFPVVLKKDNVKFRLDEMPIHVVAWEEFEKYIGIETSAIGRIGGERLWTGHSTTIKIKSDDSILIRFYGPQINPELGIQKVRVRAVLLDSSNAMQPQVLTDQLIRVSPGKNTPGYSLPLRGRLSSGDWIELQVMNPGNMNRTMQLFFVERQWHEAFRGAISYSLIQVPFDSDKESRFLGSLGFGINYIPWVNRPFISFDWDFMIGNPVSTTESVNVDVGMGVSAILWNYIQIGFGTNLSGSPFSEPFIYLGSRLALPFSKPNN